MRRRSATRPSLDHRDQDVPLRLVLGGIVLFVLPIAALYYAIVGTLGIALAMTIVMVRRGIPVFGRQQLHGGARRLVEQPGVRHHDRDDPADVAAAAGADGPGCEQRPGGRDHGRRRRLLRGRDRCRYDARPSRRLLARRDAVAAAGRAGARRRRGGARDGADPELAAERLRHRRAHRRATERVAGAASESDGVRRARRVRRRACRGR